MKTYDELLAERDALAAQVEACNDVLKTLLKSLPWIGGSLQVDGQFYYKVAESVFKKAESALAKTPQQCLAEIRAEAVEVFARALSNTVQIPNGPITRVDYYKAAIRHAIQFAEQYAAKLRKGGE